MTTSLKKEILINAPKEKVWSVVSDYGNVYLTSPNVAKSFITSDKKSGVGATRHCDFVGGGNVAVEEVITNWKDGESLTIDITEFKNFPMIKSLEGDFSVKSQGSQTLLSGIVTYEMLNFFGKIMNVLMMKRTLNKNWANFLAGIKYNVETGKPVDENTELDTSPVKDAV